MSACRDSYQTCAVNNSSTVDTTRPTNIEKSGEWDQWKPLHYNWLIKSNYWLTFQLDIRVTLNIYLQTWKLFSFYFFSSQKFSYIYRASQKTWIYWRFFNSSICGLLWVKVLSFTLFFQRFVLLKSFVL